MVLSNECWSCFFANSISSCCCSLAFLKFRAITKYKKKAVAAPTTAEAVNNCKCYGVKNGFDFTSPVSNYGFYVKSGTNLSIGSCDTLVRYYIFTIICSVGSV